MTFLLTKSHDYKEILKLLKNISRKLADQVWRNSNHFARIFFFLGGGGGEREGGGGAQFDLRAWLGHKTDP